MRYTEKFSKVLGLFLLLIMFPLGIYAQKATVKGTVSDVDGPLIGATVKVKGASVGTVTDLNGKYSISVSPGEILEFSYLGYDKKEIKIGNKSTLNVMLNQDEKVLNEVVVVGYGQMKRTDLTGSVVSIDDKAIKKAIPTSIDQVLQGRAAGVQIQQNTGTPGGSASIRIRGTNSINATNQPIFVIDGVIIDSSSEDSGNTNPLASINPNDIVSMDVLKDASATAIYGSRASNGVIMVTTKRGEKGEARITYDGYVGWQQMPKSIDVLNLQEYATHNNAIADANIKTANSSFVRPDLLGSGTDWQKEIFRTALMTSHNLSMQGGSDQINYAISGGYLNQDGIAIGTSYKRFTLRSNVDAQIKKWLRGGLSFSLADSKQETATSNGVIMIALQSQPSVAVTNPDGTYDGPDDVWQPENPVALAMITDNYNKKQNFRVNTYLEATLLKGLTFKTELSLDYNINKYYYYQPDYKFGIKTSDTRTGKWTAQNTKYYSWRNILTYDNTFAEKHHFTAMLGQEMSESHWEQQVSTATGYLSNTAKDPSAGDITQSTGNGTQVNSSLFSYFGRAFYSYDDRYLATFTLRNDGSSKFADGHRWGWFPSAALAWKVSNEAFLKDNNVVNNMKLRLGWGQTGNQNVENWAYMALLSTKTTPWGTGVLNGNTANPDLKWETTTSYNIGFDINLFHNRIEFIADWYYKKTKDLLLQIPLPAFLGSSGSGAAANPWSNIGSIKNTGIELTLNTVNVDHNGFQWRSNIIFSKNKNEVLSLDTENSELYYNFGVGSDYTNVTKTVVGKPIGQFWGYKVIGMFNEPTDFYYEDESGNVKPIALPTGVTIGENGAWLGDYIFADINNDGVIDNNDETFIGNPEPDFTFGFGNTFSWKGFDLNIFFNGSVGNDVVNYGRRWLDVTGSSSNVRRDVLDYARVEMIDPNGPNDFRNYHVTNPGTTIPRLYTTSNANMNWRMSDAYVEDGSYIRLQNISLGYTFPKNWIKGATIENLKVYANIQNLFTISKYKGFDPEVGSLYGNTLMNGIDYGRYPSPRIYTIGLTVTL